MIFYECYADESLLKSIGYTKKQLVGGHSFGRSRVSTKLKKVSSSIAFIDEDPGKPQDSYIKQLLQQQIYSDSYLICCKDNQRNNTAILLRPDLENFSLRIAKDSNINLIEYKLDPDFKKLHAMLSPQTNTVNRAKFEQFLQDVSNHPAILKLRELIK